MVPEEFIWVGGDVHIYTNQEEGIREQLSRQPLYQVQPKVRLNPEIKNLFDFTYEDIEIVDYESHPAIKFPEAAV